ncbi:hypothetical protein FGO68_gene6880 [Halteria grandinella]|uniref:Uncharacterized protein n=1 Tax=Halteria grandinella TaxID=5974 RepID=A0A8J8NMV1_HALGN|nr:hypothetical protein FGO68_gene6880 [Halteria grandinella]
MFKTNKTQRQTTTRTKVVPDQSAAGPASSSQGKLILGGKEYIRALGSKQNSVSKLLNANPHRDTYYSMLGANPRFDQGDPRPQDFTKKTLKHTKTTYDFLTDHSQKVGPPVKPIVAHVRQTTSGTKIFNPTKYEQSEKIVSGAPKANYTARNYFLRSTHDDLISPQPARKVSVSKLAEILGSNTVTPQSTDEYFIFGPPKTARDSIPQRAVHESPAKQERIKGIHASGNMRESLSYNDNDVTYGIVQTKQGGGNMFERGNLVKEVWKPKTATKWHEEYRAPLTLQ